MDTYVLSNVEDAWDAIKNCSLFNSSIIERMADKVKTKTPCSFQEEIFLDKPGVIHYSVDVDGVALIRISVGEANLAALRLDGDVLEMEGLGEVGLMAETQALGTKTKNLEDFC